jgi:hypothetical protein
MGTKCRKTGIFLRIETECIILKNYRFRRCFEGGNIREAKGHKKPAVSVRIHAAPIGGWGALQTPSVPERSGALSGAEMPKGQGVSTNNSLYYPSKASCLSWVS